MLGRARTCQTLSVGQGARAMVDVYGETDSDGVADATAIVRAEKDGVAYFCLFASDLIEAAAREAQPSALAGRPNSR